MMGMIVGAGSSVHGRYELVTNRLYQSGMKKEVCSILLTAHLLVTS